MTTMQIIIAGAWICAFGSILSKTVSGIGALTCIAIALAVSTIGMVI